MKTGVKEGKKQAKDSMGKENLQSPTDWKQENNQQINKANQHKDSIVNDFGRKQQAVVAGLKRRNSNLLWEKDNFYIISMMKRRQLLGLIWDDYALG